MATDFTDGVRHFAEKEEKAGSQSRPAFPDHDFWGQPKAIRKLATS
jgi:hypothetical protein